MCSSAAQPFLHQEQNSHTSTLTMCKMGIGNGVQRAAQPFLHQEQNSRSSTRMMCKMGIGNGVK